MHVVDVSEFHLEETKRIQLSLGAEADSTGRKHHRMGKGGVSLKEGIKHFTVTESVSLNTSIQRTHILQQLEETQLEETRIKDKIFFQSLKRYLTLNCVFGCGN